MIFIKAFILTGLISLIGQIILDNIKITPGHITALFTVLGAVLSFLGLYKHLINFSLIGSLVPITSFGNSLYQAALQGFENNGLIGIFQNMFSTSSAAISSSIIFAFLISLIFNPKD